MSDIAAPRPTRRTLSDEHGYLIEAFVTISARPQWRSSSNANGDRGGCWVKPGPPPPVPTRATVGKVA